MPQKTDIYKWLLPWKRIISFPFQLKLNGITSLYTFPYKTMSQNPFPRQQLPTYQLFTDFLPAFMTIFAA